MGSRATRQRKAVLHTHCRSSGTVSSRQMPGGILAAARDKGLLASGGKARTDSTRVLSAARELRWLEMAAETFTQQGGRYRTANWA